ncbi:DUF2170 family protein [Halomonas sp. TD01]|uniref:DUF2170 family protein n=1 Tax=Halomonas sp. TD01 TaxID=999141 RepID=UPI000214F9A8|nr:DUF2170 family protein [Halomonas sp. TD01]EGP18789.1 putative cytoplasmic protein [Halomonas sp. TD01]CAH1042191.1 FIG006163: hypothetical protein [Halomonas sp. TD01]
MNTQTRLEAIKRSVEQNELNWPNADITLDQDNDSLVFTLKDYGDLPVTLTYSDEEWLVMTEVAPTSAVEDINSFNDALLRLGMALPLVSVGIHTLVDEDYYVVYGQLFADCKLEAISAEVEACAQAALEIADLID